MNHGGHGDGGWLRFPAALGNVARVMEIIKDDCRAYQVPDGEIGAIELAVTEALNNAIEHGAKENDRESIFVQWHLEEQSIFFEIEDPGNEIPETGDAELPDDPLCERGRGTFLIHELMDEVVHFLAGGRHRLQLIKHLGNEPVAPESRAELEATVSAMAEELSTSYENLSALFRLGEQLAFSPSFPVFMESSLAELMELTQADGAMVCSWTDEGRTLVIQGTRGTFDPFQGRWLRRDAGVFLTEVAQSTAERSIEADDGLEPSDPLAAVSGHYFTIPMAFADQPVGVLILNRRPDGPFFSSGDIQVGRTFTDFLSIAIVLEQLQIQRANEEIAIRELEIAADLQRRLLPETFPVTNEFTVHGTCTSARQVGGDYLDAIPMDDGSVFLVIADVMGKGVSAAMLATVFRTALYARLDLLRSPDRLMAEMAGQLHHDIGKLDMFITAQMAFCDATERRVHLCSAGHCPALYWIGREECELLSEGGMPLGIFNDTDYPLITREFPVGARLALITDGFYEVENEQGEWLNLEGLVEMARPSLKLGGYPFVVNLLKGVNAFTGEAPQTDDRSALVIDSNPDEDREKTQWLKPS